MTDTDPTLSKWERGERRRSILLAGATALLLAMTGLVLIGAFVMADLVDILHRRSPVIARIDAAEQRDECVGRIGSSFLAGVGELLDARLDEADDPTRDALALTRVQVARDALVLITDPDVDPCSVPLPIVHEETP